jgi:hypothetical protein
MKHNTDIGIYIYMYVCVWCMLESNCYSPLKKYITRQIRDRSNLTPQPQNITEAKDLGYSA